ncbi:MAG TPA: DUF2063 domain-containing protein [Oxalobacteraceae bacterium]|nr:DUF2063 domain-containing protein [Oxalobacteraceae bacterium]
MSSRLADFQGQFAQALFIEQSDAAPEIANLMRQPGFAIYRNTVIKSRIDALQANYPAVARLVGEAWFRATAAFYARENSPRDPVMLSYGETFPTFLQQFEPAGELGYLPGVARLDRFWGEAHAAQDEPVLDPDAIAGFTPQALGCVVLQPHAAARWAWFEALPVYTIWERNREQLDDDNEIAWQGEGALLVRPHAAVEWIPLGAGGCAFLDACMAGYPLAEAAMSGLEVQEDLDLARLLARLIEAGAFRA